ncbi:ankyrin repeat domain-containing protein [Actinomadura alba]|uniref:ankyrin repeat domain-containing protein n=1 Tax=Actinomadura alba TaxID=406431 RepID=UPI001C9D1019|nr:ankyrin repeat domain-containing protein [Actinomadura alba]
MPQWMIEQAAERRLAGDWRGACGAAGIDIAFDLADVAREHGRKIVTVLEDDLRHFAPDLLRWHLPRLGDGRTTINPNQVVVLGGYGGGRRSRRPDTPRLYVTTPGWMPDGPQRLTLRFGRVARVDESRRFWPGTVENWTAARHLWDVRHTIELRERCGGGADRAPFLNPDGTPRATDELPTTAPGLTDPAARTEWVTALHERGEVEAAFAAAGIDLNPLAPDLEYGSVQVLEPLERMPLALTRLGPEIQRLADEGHGDRFLLHPFERWRIAMLFERKRRNGGLRAQCIELDEVPDVVLPEACWRRSPDLDLLRIGQISPDHLHPLVRDALFPDRPATGGPVGPPEAEPPSPVRVRCRGEWHEMSFRDGTLHTQHGDEEEQRERAMSAFGGTISGCFAVQRTWTSGIGRLPRALRDQWRELFARIQHGDTPGVIRLLDAGVDPHARDGRRRTLLHLLHLLDHEPLLPRLLAAGLDIEATDKDHRTPLHVAVGENGSAELIRALLTAGARIDVVDPDSGLSVHYLSVRGKRRDLRFLEERLERDHPDLCTASAFLKEHA